MFQVQSYAEARAIVDSAPIKPAYNEFVDNTYCLNEFEYGQFVVDYAQLCVDQFSDVLTEVIGSILATRWSFDY